MYMATRWPKYFVAVGDWRKILKSQSQIGQLRAGGLLSNTSLETKIGDDISPPRRASSRRRNVSSSSIGFGSRGNECERRGRRCGILARTSQLHGFLASFCASCESSEVLLT